MDPVSIKDFRKLELRTATIVDVKDHPNADRLWVLTVDTGGENTFEIVAGIKNAYSADALRGRKAVVIVNLEPAEIRGVKSCGMLLAAKMGDELSIVVPERDLPAGSIVS